MVHGAASVVELTAILPSIHSSNHHNYNNSSNNNDNNDNNNNDNNEKFITEQSEATVLVMVDIQSTDARCHLPHRTQRSTSIWVS